MNLKFLIATFISVACIRGQNNLLGSVRRVNVSSCKDLLAQLDAPYTDILLKADMASCDIQVVAGVVYRMRFFNVSSDTPKCYFEVWRKSARKIIINDQVKLEENCAILLANLPVTEVTISDSSSHTDDQVAVNSENQPSDSPVVDIPVDENSSHVDDHPIVNPADDSAVN